jgi:hypothetical protein
MKKLLGLAALALALAGPAGAFDLPRVSFGPYAAAYLMDCATINNQVLCVNGNPSLGAAPLFGVETKVFLPKNFFVGINLGYSSQKTVADNPYWPSDTIKTAGKLRVVPLSLALGHDFQLMPKFLFSAGLSAGYTWAAVQIDSQVLYKNGQRYRSHTAGRGGNPFVGLMSGIILNLHRHIDFSLNFEYRFGDIKQLAVSESDDPARIGSIIKYYDESSNMDQPIPLEISNLLYCYAIKYRF